MCPVTRFFAVQTISSFWWDLENFSQKSVPSYTFCSLWRLKFLDWDLKFLRRVGKFRQKGVTSYTIFSQYRLSQVFDGTWKNFHKKSAQLHVLFSVETISKIFTKKCAQSHVLFAVETILCFGWDLEKYRQKCVPSYTFCSLWRLL